MTTAKPSQGVSSTRNPAAGTVLTAPAGGEVEAEFDFINDSPDVAAFHLEVEGLPAPRWAWGAGPGHATQAAASSGGSLRLKLTPPAGAPVGDYDLRVRIVSGGVTVGAGEVPLVLQVEPALAEDGQGTRPEPPAASPISSPPPPASAATVTDPVEAPAQHVPAPPPRAPAGIAPAPPPPAPAPAPGPSAAAAQPAAPAPPPQEAPPPAPRSVAPAAPAPKAEALPIVDLAASRPPVAEEEEEEEQAPAEPSVLNPREGSVLSVRPGETLLVRFGFTNEGPRERTYVLDEDRSLEAGWITLVQDQVNLTRNGRGEVAIRLTPPVDAEPGSYPFTVTVGPQGGALASVPLALAVLAAPAVRLAAKATTVTAGPFAAGPEFQLSVESAGNADTAFRIAVKAPRVAADRPTPVPGPEDLHETPQWRYLFDKEMEDLRSPASDRPPPPEPIRLRVQRKGTWWFGVRETHRLRVGAAPVTDPTNAGKSENAVELTAVRWRLSPLPALGTVPLLFLLLFLLAGGARELTVLNKHYQDPQGTYWVVEPSGEQKELQLSWDAAPLALLRLTAKQGEKVLLSEFRRGGGQYRVKVPVSRQARRVDHLYRVGRFIGGGDLDAPVAFVYTSANTPLLVTAPPMTAPLVGSQVTLRVPSQGYGRLLLTNGAPQNNRLDWWLVRTLGATSPFQFAYVKNQGSIEQGGREALLIQRRASAPLDQKDQIVFITTDARRPILTVNLEPAP